MQQRRLPTATKWGLRASSASCSRKPQCFPKPFHLVVSAEILEFFLEKVIQIIFFHLYLG